MADDFSLKIIACETLKDEITHLAPDVETEWVKGGLHDFPDQMRAEINERIAETPGRRTILLGYGRCSNGTVGLKAGPHRLILPAIDDCISLLLGSRRRYLEEFTAYPGHLLLHPRLDRGARGPLSGVREDDPAHRRGEGPRGGADDHGELHADWSSSRPAPTTWRSASGTSRRWRRFYDLPIEMLQGNMRLFRKLIEGPWDAEFIVVEPGGVLEESVFWNLPSEIDELPEDPDAAGVWGPPITIEAPCEACAAGGCCARLTTPQPAAATADG